YDSHMYRSSASQRWIELNGQRLYEGDALNQLTILRIEPQKVVLVKDSQAFSQPALEDWQP
ncbi:general secretion pathway protein GspB, partial [Burkholderia sp. SIMBA_057]